jgi:hypothetical protein
VKKLIFTVFGLVCALGALSGVWAQAYDIDVKKLPSDQAFRNHIEEFKPLYKFVAAWNSEWTAAIPKAKVVAMIEALLKDTKAFIAKDKTGSIDLLLLSAFLKTCLYNTDLPAYHDEIVRDLEAVKNQYPKDYRAYWILGNHYGSADEPFSAVKEYNTMLTRVIVGNISPAVLDDYTKVCLFTFMFSRSKAVMDGIAKDNNIADPTKAFAAYKPVMDQLKEPPVKHAFPTDLIYLSERREFEMGYLNRVLGIWIPVKDTWKTAAYELTAVGFTTFHIIMPMATSAGKSLPSEVSIAFQALPAESYEATIKKVLDSLPKKQEFKEYKSRWPATVYEFWDSEAFKENGGGRGLVVFVKRAQPAVKGIAIEAPAKFADNVGNVKINTVVLGEGYTRFNGDIYYTFMITGAEDTFEASKKEFFDFLDRVLLD